MKVPDGTIDRRARESRGTRDEGDPPSPQLFGIEGDDEVSLPLIEVGEQRGVFLLQFFFSAHTGSISGRSPIVTIIILQALTSMLFWSVPDCLRGASPGFERISLEACTPTT